MTNDALLNNTSIQENKFHTKTIELKGRSYSNQIGRFPVTSSKGNKYKIHNNNI